MYLTPWGDLHSFCGPAYEGLGWGGLRRLSVNTRAERLYRITAWRKGAFCGAWV